MKKSGQKKKERKVLKFPYLQLEHNVRVSRSKKSTIKKVT